MPDASGRFKENAGPGPVLKKEDIPNRFKRQGKKILKKTIGKNLTEKVLKDTELREKQTRREEREPPHSGR